MVVTPLPRVALDNLVQVENARPPMVVTLSGTVIADRLVHCRNAP